MTSMNSNESTKSLIKELNSISEDLTQKSLEGGHFFDEKTLSAQVRMLKNIVVCLKSADEGFWKFKKRCTFLDIVNTILIVMMFLSFFAGTFLGISISKTQSLSFNTQLFITKVGL